MENIHLFQRKDKSLYILLGALVICFSLLTLSIIITCSYVMKYLDALSGEYFNELVKYIPIIPIIIDIAVIIIGIIFLVIGVNYENSSSD